MNNTLDIPQRPKRSFLPENFTLSAWDNLKPYFEKLLSETIETVADLKKWLQNYSELESIVSEDMGWRYIHMTCYTENEEYKKQYQDFVEHIQPHLAQYSDLLNKKILGTLSLKELEQLPGFNLMIRNLKKEVEIFREANIPLATEITTKTHQYSRLSSAMTIDWHGKELTLQQASVLLMDTDRTIRQQAYRQISSRRLQDKDTLDELFTELIRLRHQISQNSGFDNFRDYMFKAYGRFDYTPKDCFHFHESIQSEVVPLLNELSTKRKKELGVESLKPWDLVVDPLNREALKTFADGKDLITKSISCFTKIDPYLGNCLSIMNKMGHLDLESRKGKAPGGYNYPLAEIGVPFIFMNATSTLRDLTTIMHEGGHAIHNFLTRNLELNAFKSPPMEVAELASMSMELISMDEWTTFFPTNQELKRAKREHLESIIQTLPWVAIIDHFQHWIYENPTHSMADRKTHWTLLFNQFSDTITDWTELDDIKSYLWQKQLHLYEVPFYYIEYGIAQLGAIAIWRNYKLNKQKGLQAYMNALRLGYTQSIPEIYRTANIQFNFNRDYIRELISFVKEEWSLL